jgi:Glycosyl transferase family 11
VSVSVQMFGRLGNNLFQYAFARIIATQLGFELNCQQLPTTHSSLGGQILNVGNSATMEDLIRFFPNAPLHIPGLRAEYPVESFEISPDKQWRGQSVDFHGMLANHGPRAIRLRGWFQRLAYYSPYRDTIRRWFLASGVVVPHTIQRSDVVLNIRRGADFGLNGWTVPLHFYHQALSSIDRLGKIYICGTCIDDNVFRSFERYKPIFYSATPIDHFVFITRFNNIVLSNSTFAWWAAFLSDAESIIAPRFSQPGAYSFTGFDDVDLNMRNARYRELEVKGPARFGLFRRNKKIHFNINVERLEIQESGLSIRLDDSNRELLAWLVEQDGLLGLEEIERLYRGHSLRDTLNRLVSSGFLVLDARYLDQEDSPYSGQIL